MLSFFGVAVKSSTKQGLKFSSISRLNSDRASGDRQILSKALNISPSQQNYITNSNAGEGLIFYGSTIVPFKDDFPKNTQLYRIMTTKPEETVQN